MLHLVGNISEYEDVCSVMIFSRLILLRVRNISDNFVDTVKTHILYSIILFFFFENREVL